MKKSIIGIVIVAALFSISAITIEVSTVKLAKPSSIVVLSDYYTDGMIRQLNKYISMGYRVVSVTNGGKDAYVIGVVEKY